MTASKPKLTEEMIAEIENGDIKHQISPTECWWAAMTPEQRDALCHYARIGLMQELTQEARGKFVSGNEYEEFLKFKKNSVIYCEKKP